MSKYSFNKFLNPQAIVGALNKMPPLHTPIMDLIYPESVQVNHPFSTIAYEDIGAVLKNIPLVSRGSSSYAVPFDGSELRHIEPQNLEPSNFVGANKINDLRNLPGQTQQQFINNKIDQLRRLVRASKEAMAVQSLTGEIAYDLRTANGGLEKFKVKFGTIKTVTINTKWNANGVKASNMISDIGKMVAKIKEKSGATDFVGLVDFDTYAAMVDLVNNASTKLPIEVTTEYVVIGGVKVYVTAATYYDYSTKQNIPVVAAKKIKIVGRDDGFGFYNCALDSIDANFAGLPFGVREVSTDDPEGIKLIGMSRPMPIPNVDAICEAVVLS